MAPFDDPTLIALNDPFEQPLHFLGLELVVAVSFALTLVHAVRRLRAGEPRHLFQWLAILAYGVAIELIAFHYYQNYDHGRFSVQLYHGLLPLYVTFLYCAFHYTGIKIAERLRLGAAAEALVAGLAICLLDVPFDTLGPPAGWWTWSAEDPVLAARWLGVPVTSYFWYLSFGAVLTALCRAMRGPLARRGAIVFAAAPAVALGTFALGVVAFLPFHGLVALGVPPAAIVACHAAAATAVALLYTSARARPLPHAIAWIPILLYGFHLGLLGVFLARGELDRPAVTVATVALATALTALLVRGLPLRRRPPTA